MSSLWQIQQRRGLKQDLPHPLRPGEIGFATDSRQVYIGADTDDTVSKTYNKTVYLENTLGAQATSLNIANAQIIKFEVPHIRFVKGSSTFDGVSKTQSWFANTSTSYNLSDNSNVARTTFDVTVANSGNAVVNQNQTAKAFDADDVTVLIDGKKQVGDSSGTGATVNASFDYNFVTGNATGDSHTVYFRTAPTNAQQVAITYYGNSHVNHAIANSVIANGATVTGFHTQMSIPEYRYLNPDLVLVNPEAGSGFIGLETKHIDVVQEGSGIANVANLTLGNIVAVKDPLDPSLFSPDPANANAQIYTGISNVSAVKSGTVHGGEIVTFDMGADSITFTEYANASGGYNGYVWLEGQSGTAVAGNTQIETQHYLHQKLLPIQANSVGTTFTITTPANTFQTGRAVTTAGSGTLTVTGNVEGLTNGDKVRFAGANATNFTNAPYTISSLNTGAGTFQVTEAGQTTNIAGDLDFINHGANAVSYTHLTLPTKRIV